MAQQGTTAREYVTKMPDNTPTEIAKEIMEDCPGLFTSTEAARARVRYYMGKHGAKNRVNADIVPVVPSQARICIMDIETSPMPAWVWGSFKQFINPNQLVAPQSVLCWCAKWLDEEGVMFDSMQDQIPVSDSPLNFIGCSDERVCASMWRVFDDADIIVAHNGRAFDVATLNARWLYHGMGAPSPYRVVDTLKICRNFRFPRNKLESIARYMELGGKEEHEGFGLWLKCMQGDKAAWQRMEDYNVRDVTLLEDVYMKLRTWDTRHPNVALHYQDGHMRCIVCGSTAVHEDTAHQAHTMASVFPTYKCDSCGKTMRGRKRLDPTAAIEDRLTHSL